MQAHDHTFQTKKSAWKNIEYSRSSNQYKKMICEIYMTNNDALFDLIFSKSKFLKLSPGRVRIKMRVAGGRETM